MGSLLGSGAMTAAAQQDLPVAVGLGAVPDEIEDRLLATV